MTEDAKSPRKPEPSYGPDEEGEVPLKEDAIPARDKAAWVHQDKGQEKKGALTHR